MRTIFAAMLAALSCAAHAESIELRIESPAPCDEDAVVGIHIPEADNLDNLKLEVRYDPEQFELADILQGSGIAGWTMFDYNELEPGRVLVGGAAFYGTPVSGDLEAGVMFFKPVCSEPPCTMQLVVGEPNRLEDDAQRSEITVSCHNPEVAETPEEPAEAVPDYTAPTAPAGELPPAPPKSGAGCQCSGSRSDTGTADAGFAIAVLLALGVRRRAQHR